MARQQELEGVPPRPIIPELTAAAEVYERARDAWLEASRPVQDAKKLLIAAMQQHGIEKYDVDDLHVKLKPGKARVEVRRGDEDDDSEE